MWWMPADAADAADGCEWLIIGLVALPLYVLALPLTIPIAVFAFFGERHARQQAAAHHKTWVATRTRLLPAFAASISNQLDALLRLLRLLPNDDHAKDLGDDLRALVEDVLRFEEMFLLRLQAGEQCGADRGFQAHFADINPAVQRRIEYNAARISDGDGDGDGEILRQFSALYDILNRYRRSFGSNEFLGISASRASMSK